jgi:hypothetical protein
MFDALQFVWDLVRVVAGSAPQLLLRGLKTTAFSHLFHMADRSKITARFLACVARKNDKNIFQSIARTEIKKATTKAWNNLFRLEMALVADIFSLCSG